MNGGALDRRITIERATEAENDFGELIETFATYVTLWASRSDVSDAEKLANSELGSALVSRFVVRSNSSSRTITTQDRISYDGATWNIHGVKETAMGRKRYIEITAARNSD